MTNVVSIATDDFNLILKSVGSLIDPEIPKEAARFIALNCTKDKITASACNRTSAATINVPCLDLRTTDPFETLIPLVKPVDKKECEYVTISDFNGEVTVSAGNHSTTVKRPLEPAINLDRTFTNEPPQFSVLFDPKLLIQVLKAYISAIPKKAKCYPVRLNLWRVRGRGGTTSKVILEVPSTLTKYKNSPKAVLYGIIEPDKDEETKGGQNNAKT